MRNTRATELLMMLMSATRQTTTKTTNQLNKPPNQQQQKELRRKIDCTQILPKPQVLQFPTLFPDESIHTPPQSPKVFKVKSGMLELIQIGIDFHGPAEETVRQTGRQDPRDPEKPRTRRKMAHDGGNSKVLPTLRRRDRSHHQKKIAREEKAIMGKESQGNYQCLMFLK